MDGTIITQGRFTSDGLDLFLNLRQGVDWIEVFNYTESAATNINHGVSYSWMRGMANGDGFVTYHPAADATLAIDTSAGLVQPGFTLFDDSSNPVGAPVALTSISNANPPRVLVASTAALRDGDIVRIINTAGGLQLGAMDFTIDVADGTHFDLINMPAIVAAAGPGVYRVISHEGLYTPRNRTITKITQAAQAVVTTSVDHAYHVGDKIRFYTNTDGNAAFGMTEINGMLGNIVAITQHTFTVDIDTTGFTAFTFPLTGAVAFSPAQVVPVGENIIVGSLDDAKENTGIMGIRLAAGVLSPAGSNGDVIYWKAGTSFSVDNQ